MNVERAARIASLASHPAWPDLVAEIEERRAKYREAVADKMMSTGTAFPDFEYRRGVLAGLKEMAGYPERAKRVVAKDAQKEEASE